MFLRWDAKGPLLAAVVILWGSSFALVKIAVATVPPIWIMAARLAIAGMILSAALFGTGRRFPTDRRSWTLCFAIAILGNVVPFFLIAWGLNYIPSALSGILMAVTPLAVVVLAHFFLPDEPLHSTKIAGFVLGFLGVVVILGPERLLNVGMGGNELWGELAVIAATLCYSVQNIIARRLNASSALETAAAALVLAAAIGLALALFFAPAGMAHADRQGLIALVASGVLTTGLATVVYFQLIRVAGASFASLVNYLIPVYALCAGALLLGETLTVSDVAGLAMILFGLALSQKAKLNKAESTSS